MMGEILVRTLNTDNDASIKTLVQGSTLLLSAFPHTSWTPQNIDLSFIRQFFNLMSCAGCIAATLNTICSGNWCGPYHGDAFRGQILARQPWTTQRLEDVDV